MAATIRETLDNGIAFHFASAHGNRQFKAMLASSDGGIFFQNGFMFADTIHEARLFVDKHGGVGVIAKDDEILEHTVSLPRETDQRQASLF